MGPSIRSSDANWILTGLRNLAKSVLRNSVVGVGGLWTLGVGLQAFLMGQALRKSYWKDLSRDYRVVSEHVSVFSTFVDRTKDTAHGALLGFFSADGTRPQLDRGDCSCRPNKGDSSNIECAAQCLGIEVPVDGIPAVKLAQVGIE